MKFRRFSMILVFLLIWNTLAATFVFAKTEPASKLNVVALGDSITFGYPPPSATAFPDLISGADHVVKFGGSGATSSQLLQAINTDPKAFRNAVKNADVIIINIGSNDFMQATGLAELFAKLQPLIPNLDENLKNGEVAKVISSTKLTPLTPQQLALYSGNLAKMIAAIKLQTNAPIILYNLYNPIVLSTDPVLNAFLKPLYTFVDGNLKVVNTVIQQFERVKGVYTADAYAAFKANPAAYILPFDIHPTPAGHKALASLADSILQPIAENGNGTNENHDDAPYRNAFVSFLQKAMEF